MTCDEICYFPNFHDKLLYVFSLSTLIHSPTGHSHLMASVEFDDVHQDRKDALFAIFCHYCLNTRERYRDIFLVINIPSVFFWNQYSFRGEFKVIILLPYETVSAALQCRFDICT